MSAFSRRFLAALAVAGAVFAATAPASSAASAGPQIRCPQGTHWDNGKHACVS